MAFSHRGHVNIPRKYFSTCLSHQKSNICDSLITGFKKLQIVTEIHISRKQHA